MINLEKRTLVINTSAKQEAVKQYHLIQYTPHIHFQHKEPGACLRASEVKPKLDKFILAYCKRHNYVLPDECFVLRPGEEKTALNYKIQIYPKNSEIVRYYIPDAQRDGYLGNQNKPRADLTKTVFYPDGLSLSLIIENIKLRNAKNNLIKFQTLADLIDYVLPAFFLLNCFGARSTKGYGSYAIRGKQLWDYRRDTQYVKADLYLREFIDAYYVIEFPRDIRKTDLPKKAIIISNLMKSGYNMTFGNPEDYYKGRILKYFRDKDMGGDKAFIKQNVLTGKKDRNRNSEDYRSYTKYRFVRTLLGFGKEIMFVKGVRAGRTAVFKDAKINTANAGDNTEIIRFNNPVHFVPNGQYLLIIPTEIPEVMSERRFEVYEKDAETNHAPITTPEIVAVGKQDLGKGKFNLEQFLDMFMDDFNHQTDFCRKGGKYKSPINQLFYSERTGEYTLTMTKVG